MEVSSSHQVYVLVLCVLSGMLCGVVFDLQRFWRKIRFAGYARTLFEDVLFAILCIVVTIGLSFHFNNGEIRYYQVMGSVSGALFYAAFLSKPVMAVMQLVYKIFRILVIMPVIKIFTLLIFPVKKITEISAKLFAKIKKRLSGIARNVKSGRKRLKKRIKML